MIESKKFSALRLQVLEDTGKKNPTADDVLNCIFGEHDEYNSSDYAIYKYASKTKRSLIQRLNIIWVYPIFFITIPVQWLIWGGVGLNRNTRIGRIVDKLIKFD